MDAQDTPITQPISRSTDTHTRLSGRLLTVVRIAWTGGLVVLAVMYALGFFAVRDALSVPCAQDDCSLRVQVQHGPNGDVNVKWPGPPIGYTERLNGGKVAALESLGVTVEQYAMFGTLQMVIPAFIYLAIAALLFWRKSDDGMVLFASVMAATFPIQSLPLGFTLTVRQPAWEWVLLPANIVGLSTFLIFPLIFPTGRFVLRWTRVIAVLVIIASIISFFQLTVLKSTEEPTWLLLLLLLSFGAGAFAQVYRYFRVASPAERQQIKWVVIGVISFVIGTFGLFLPLDQIIIPAIGASNPTLAFLVRTIAGPLFLVLNLFIPISITIAVFRYRLWDIDYVINRSLVYVALTILLLALLAGGFFAIRALLGSILGSGQDLVAIAVPAIGVTALFNPARRWLRRFVDQRLYGIKIDYTPGKVAAPGVAAPRSSLGQYEGLKLIGRGGMAEVYKATHPTLGRPVAIKVLPHSLAQDPDFRKRFEREAKTVATLKHPNIVQLFDFGEADGTAYMVIEYIGGPDVGDVIKEYGAMPVDRALAITREVAGALDYAHRQGLVHRDIKPSNVMIEPVTLTGANSRGERSVLMDFGIARILGGNTRITASGVIGTLDYMSPEQIKDAKDVDGRADIYSLGVMLFQMITGRLPFTASNPGALLIAHLNQPAPDPRTIRADIPEDASLAALKAMEKNPDDRFQTAGDFAMALS